MRFWQRCRALLLAALACAGLVTLPAWGRTVLELDAGRQPVRLADWGDAWIDPTGQALPASVASSPTITWTPTRDGAIYGTGEGKVLWIRFTVPPAPDSERWYLEIPYPAVNRVTLYSPDSTGQWAPISAGDEVPVADWPLPHRHPVLPVAVSAESPRAHLLKVENPHSFSAPLQFISESWLNRDTQQVSLLLGMFFGLAALSGVLGAIRAVELRDSAYALYALSVLAMGLTQASITGIAGMHLWPTLPWWNDVSAIALPVLTVGAFLWFFSAVVSLPDRSRFLHHLLIGLALASLVVATIIMVVRPSLRIVWMAPYVAGATLIGFSAIVWATRRGDRYGPWLLASSVPVIIAGAFPLLRAAGVLPVGFGSMHGMQIGIAIQLPILLLMLLLRSQQRREHNRRIQGLDRMDPATGLINGYVFTERLGRLMARSTRLKYQSAVLLVDIVNMDVLRRDFSHSAAQEMPLRVAGRLLSAAREIDSVARLSDLRFGMLIEGPLTPEDAASAGPRVVARCLMPFKKLPLECVAQVRVAQILVPLESSDPNAVIDQLEAVLAAVPPDSKRAVFNLK
jgi:GGDEF domain-containing protein